MKKVYNGPMIEETPLLLKRRDFLKIAAIAPFSLAIPSNQDETDTVERAHLERVSNYIRKIKDIWGVTVTLDSSVAAESSLEILKEFEAMMQTLPPTFFEQCSTMAHKLREANAVIGNTKQDARLDKKLSFHLAHLNAFPTVGHYSGNPPKITLDIDHISYIFFHELAHYIHDVFGQLPNSAKSSDAYVGRQDSEIKTLATQYEQYWKLYPQFVSSYAITNAGEDFAEVFSRCMKQPMNEYFLTTEGKLKYILIRELLLKISQGYMDDEYFEKLKNAEVNLDYWNTKQPSVFFDAQHEGQVLYLADLDKSEGELQGLVRNRLITEGHTFPSYGKTEMSVTDSQVIFFRHNTSQKGVVEMVINGVPSLFLSLNEGDKVETIIQTEQFLHTLYFQCKNGEIHMSLLESISQEPELVPFVSSFVAQSAFQQKEKFWSLLFGIVATGVAERQLNVGREVYENDDGTVGITRRGVIKGILASLVGIGASASFKNRRAIFSNAAQTFDRVREMLHEKVKLRDNQLQTIIDNSHWWEEGSDEVYLNFITENELPVNAIFRMEVLSENELLYEGEKFTMQADHSDTFISQNGTKLVMPVGGDPYVYKYIAKVVKNAETAKVEVSPGDSLHNSDDIWAPLLARHVRIGDTIIANGCYGKITMKDGTVKYFSLFSLPHRYDAKGMKRGRQNFDPGSYTQRPQIITSELFGTSSIAPDLPEPTFMTH